MSEKLYLINLNGFKDTQITLVNEDVWNWIFSPYTDDVEKVPESVLLESEKHENVTFDAENMGTDEDGFYCVSPGSYENDRAMCAPGHSFWSMRDAIDFIKENDVEIIDEFEGYLY